MKNGLSVTRTTHCTLVFKSTSFITHTSQLLREGRGLWESGPLIVQFSQKADEWSRQPGTSFRLIILWPLWHAPLASLLEVQKLSW